MVVWVNPQRLRSVLGITNNSHTVSVYTKVIDTIYVRILRVPTTL